MIRKNDYTLIVNSNILIILFLFWSNKEIFYFFLKLKYNFIELHIRKELKKNIQWWPFPIIWMKSRPVGPKQQFWLIKIWRFEIPQLSHVQFRWKSDSLFGRFAIKVMKANETSALARSLKIADGGETKYLWSNLRTRHTYCSHEQIS